MNELRQQRYRQQAPQEAPRGPRGVPLPRLLHMEAKKFVDTTAGRGVLIAILVIVLLAYAAVSWSTRDQRLHQASEFLGAGLLGMMVLLPVLGIMSVAGEWATRSHLTTYTLEPRRLRVLAAKSAVVIGACLVAMAIALVLAVAAAHLMALVVGGEARVPFSAGLLARTALGMALLGLQGVAFGALFLNTPLGIVAYFVVPTILSIAVQAIQALQERAAWFDANKSLGRLFQANALSGTEWAQVASVVGIWVVLPLAIGAVRIVRREVK